MDTQQKIKEAIRSIGETLSFLDGCITTDRVDTQENGHSWTNDHDKELAHLDFLESLFNKDICPLCLADNNRL